MIIHIIKKNPLYLFASIIFCCLLTSMICAWQWHSDWLLAHQTNPVIQKSLQKDDRAQLIHDLPKKHIFGKALRGDAPITNLQFSVTGIVKMVGGHGSKAYISTSGQASKIYHIGDKLSAGVIIYDITENSVLLENNDRIEKILLARKPLQYKKKIKINEESENV